MLKLLYTTWGSKKMLTGGAYIDYLVKQSLYYFIQYGLMWVAFIVLEKYVIEHIFRTTLYTWGGSVFWLKKPKDVLPQTLLWVYTLVLATLLFPFSLFVLK